MSETPFLELDGLGKSFGDVRVLEDLSLSLAEGEILALLGLSGSGKTTALRLLAGFEQPDQGSIRVAGETVGHLGPDRRGFGMVFQHYALFPHMTVRENVAFGLETRGWDKDRMAARVIEMLSLVDLEGFADRRISAISGGQQQRVALARALAPEPRLLLLDEPLSNLDPALRERTRTELREAVKRIGITTVLVTHEQEEAFHVGDRIAVLNRGRLEQVGSAQDLYRRPETPFVASFIGRSGSVVGKPDSTVKSGEVGWVELDAASPGRSDTVGARTLSWSGVASTDLEAGATVELRARPESLRLAKEPGPGLLEGKVIELRFTGPLTYAMVEVGAGQLEAPVGPGSGYGPEPKPGQRVWIGPRSDDEAGPEPRLFPVESTPGSRARAEVEPE